MMYIITDNEIDKLSESSKNDFYRILDELNPSINLQHIYTDLLQSNCCQIRRCGDDWMLCDGICTKCARYLGTSATTNTNSY